MARCSVQEAAEAVRGQVTGDPGTAFSGAALDSRKIEGGELFLAFSGENTDGHAFVADAFARGAAAAMIQQPVAPPETGALITVPDTFRALHDLTRHLRRRVPEKLAGITGSA